MPMLASASRDKKVANSAFTTHEDKYNSQRFNQAVGRLAKKLIRDNRVKLRRLGAGPKPLLDYNDEQFIANAIESKSSVHGRRHDSVLIFLGRALSHTVLADLILRFPRL
jgi:hypothetical protein